VRRNCSDPPPIRTVCSRLKATVPSSRLAPVRLRQLLGVVLVIAAVKMVVTA